MSAPTARELTGPPSLPALYARAVLPKRAAHSELPEQRLVLRDQRARQSHLDRYARLCGFSGTSQLPATYPHMVAFAPSMALMTAREFPFPLLGLVHITNRIEQLRPLAPGEALTYQVWAEGLRPHPKGTAFDVRAEADDGTATVWRSISTYLRRGPAEAATAPAADQAERRPKSASEPEAAHRAAPPTLSRPTLEDTWRIPGSLGRAYASVSGDRNPIHLHSLTAKPFGFRSAIAHGMWSKARCLAALEHELPDAYRVEVAFRQPVPLPASAHFAAEPAPRGWRFELRGATGKERQHLTGTVSALL